MQTASVVIVHGLWMHGAVFALMRRRLRQCGFDAHTFSYGSVRQAFDEHVHALAALIRSLRAARVHLVGHSLGGLLCLQYAATQCDARVTRLVLLGSPAKGSSVARHLAERGFGRQLLGAARQVLVSGVASSAVANLEVGVIAGNRAVGIGRLLGPLSEPHDGTVTVQETELAGVADSLLLPVTHSSMVFSTEVARQTAHFLAHGRFTRSAPR